MSLGKPEKKIHGHEASIPWKLKLSLALWFSLIAMTIITAGFIYYRSEAARIQQEKSIELATIGKMKIDQIMRWRKERSDDVRRIADSSAIKQLLGEWLSDPGRLIHKEELSKRLQLELDLGVYYRAFLVSDDHKVLLSAASQPVETGSDIWGVVEKAFKETNPVFSEFHRTSSEIIHMDIVAAVRDSTGQVMGALVLSTDASEFLFPMIQTWPTASPSAETLLVRQEGDRVAFLNDLRHQKGTALNLRLSLSLRALPAAAAVLGKTGSFSGKDYRGVKVLADIRPVPGTSWYLVSKVDADEILSEVRYRAGVVFVVGSILILWAAGVIIFLYHVQRQEDKKQSTALLRISEMRYRRLFESAKDGILLVEAETGMIEGVNPFLIELLGYSNEQFLGKKVWELGFLKDVIANKDNFLELQQKEYVRYEDLPLETADGRTIEVEFVSNVYLVGSQKVIQCNIRNITDRKQAEEALRQAEERYRELVEGTDDLITVVDAQGRFTFLNHGAKKMFGMEPQDCIGRLAFDFIHPEDRERTQKAFEGWVRDKAPRVTYQNRQVHKDGRVFEVLWNISLHFNHAGEVETVSNFARDITDLKQAEDKLRTSEAFLNGIIEHSPYSTWISDDKGTLLRLNQALRGVLNVTDEDVVGRYNVFQDELVEEQGLVPLVKRVFERGEIVRFTMHYGSTYLKSRDAKQPTDLVLDITISPVLDAQGRVLNAIIQHVDITELKRVEEELRKMNQELESRVKQRTSELAAAVKDLEAFSYSVSHDLKAPLRAMAGFANILGDDYAPQLDENGRRVIGVICDNVKKMGQLIDDLLKLAQLGKKVVDLVDIDVTKLVQSVCHEVKAELFRDRAIEVSIKPLPSAHADLVLAKQIFTNLISNAMKFTARREKAVIEIGGYDKDQERVYYVKDNGAGFDVKYADKLFGVFQRLHSQDEFGGTGIGLAIVRSAVDRHGGRVWAESTLDQGATFFFTLPKGG